MLVYDYSMPVKFKRILNIQKALSQASCFFFGARGTGKSFLIRETLSDKAFLIDLLKSELFLRLSENPALLEGMIAQSNKKHIVIDEVQKLPILLDEAHRLIEEKKYHFLLTGSSARKLKRGKANLLAGRARLEHLYPLVTHEIEKFSLSSYLLWGGLPIIQEAIDKREFLNSYIETYIKEEILAEQTARSLPHFSRFLKTAALCSGELINFSGAANDAQLSPSTVKNYFEVLQDTLIGYLLEPWTEGKKRKAIQTAKFYLFDIGVRNRILNINEVPLNTDIFGRCFEHFIFMELLAWKNYSKSDHALCFWRSVNHHEVDFILGDQLAIEVKAKRKVSERDAKNLMVLMEEGKFKEFVVVSQDPINRKQKGISYLFWKDFLKKLWHHAFK